METQMRAISPDPMQNESLNRLNTRISSLTSKNQQLTSQLKKTEESLHAVYRLSLSNLIS
jgi:hypothetical protein